ncbi:ChaC-like protein-domain-containing protein [Aspergillus cavernicola]|uniref:glutathione-specific gamma-glutamylcyclotransferase n=1 Tax=Aspergillus cavernicola TaxID=176166 RepID=A0ABR4J4X0_9EURO
MGVTSKESETQAPTDGRTWRQYFAKGDLWVFGYGSLIWKPPPHYGIAPVEWDVQDFGLRASTDHRGTPEQPGRVVTVIERGFWETLDDPLAHHDTSTTRVWGAAYHIPASHASEVHDYLDVREIDGYSVHYTPFHPFTTSSTACNSETSSSDSPPIICMVYIGQPTNPQFLRESARREPQDVAEVISRGVGQSGQNTEYLYLLEKALEGIGFGSADGHVTDLVRRVREIEGVGEASVEEEKAERDVKLSLSEGVRRGKDEELSE